MREFHHGPQRHVLEVRHLRGDDRVQLRVTLVGATYEAR